MFNKCEDKIEQGILDKVGKSGLVPLVEEEESVKETFCDQFEEVQIFLYI